MKLSKSSQVRIESFVDNFIRSEEVTNYTSDNDSDFVNYPDRAARCYDAAEFGADGKTHAEVINDWRKAFSNYISNKRLWTNPERFENAVNAHFDSIEKWHKEHGSLWQQIG